MLKKVGFTIPKGNTFLAILDQGIVSAGNFATAVLLARSLPATEFGVFVLLNSICLVLYGIQTNLIVSPFVVLGSSTAKDQMHSHLTAALCWTLALAPPFAVVLLVAAASLHRVETGLAALVYVTCWQLQETTRRSLIAFSRYADALWGDTLSFGGQAALVAALSFRHGLFLNQAFLLMAATSVAAALLQAGQSGITPIGLAALKASGLKFWELGKWLAVVSLTSIAIAPISTWTLNIFHGPASAAMFQAVMNVAGLANPILLSVPAIVIPMVARSANIASLGSGFALRAAWRYVLLFELLLSPLYVGLFVAPDAVLRWFYGVASPYVGQGFSLRIAVLISVVSVPLFVFGAVLTGLGRTRSNASMNGIGAAASLLLMPPLAYVGGSVGALLADLGSRTVRVAWAIKTLQSRATLQEHTLGEPDSAAAGN